MRERCSSSFITFWIFGQKHGQYGATQVFDKLIHKSTSRRVDLARIMKKELDEEKHDTFVELNVVVSSSHETFWSLFGAFS